MFAVLGGNFENLSKFPFLANQSAISCLHFFLTKNLDEKSHLGRKTICRQTRPKFFVCLFLIFDGLVSFHLKIVMKNKQQEQNGGLISDFQISKSVTKSTTQYGEPPIVRNVSMYTMKEICKYFQHLEYLDLKILSVSFYSGAQVTLQYFYHSILNLHPQIDQF